jgi:hypothetical protein
MKHQKLDLLMAEVSLLRRRWDASRQVSCRDEKLSILSAVHLLPNYYKCSYIGKHADFSLHQEHL